MSTNITGIAWTCGYCGRPIAGPFHTIGGQFFHPECVHGPGYKAEPCAAPSPHLPSAPVTAELRELLGNMVRNRWIEWAKTQPNPKPSWLVPWSELLEPDKEVDRQIGEAMYRFGFQCAAAVYNQPSLA